MLHNNFGDVLRADRVAVSTRDSKKLSRVNIPGVGPQHRYKFSMHAYCVIEKPLKKIPPHRERQTYYDHGEAIQGEVISAQATTDTRVQVVGGKTARHKGQWLTLFDDVYCLIEMPMRWKRGQ